MPVRKMPAVRRALLSSVALAFALLVSFAGALTFYQELGIPEKSNARAIKRAYRKLMLELHPDKLGSNSS